LRYRANYNKLTNADENILGLISLAELIK